MSLEFQFLEFRFSLPFEMRIINICLLYDIIAQIYGRIICRIVDLVEKHLIRELPYGWNQLFYLDFADFLSKLDYKSYYFSFAYISSE